MNKAEQQANLVKEAEGALHFLRKVYQEFDLMNGHLHELSEMLDKEEYAWFHDFWSKFPTYNQLDELRHFLLELKHDNEKA